MSEAKAMIPAEESDRLAKWRLERLQVAEAQKQDRLRERDQERRDTLLANAGQQRLEAAALLPSVEDITALHSQIARAKRRATTWAWAQFVAIVLAPLAVAAFYLTTIATPLFEAQAVVAISKQNAADQQGSGGLLNGLQPPVILQDAFKAHAYIQSQDMLDQLEATSVLISVFSGDAIDPLQRLQTIPLLHVSQRMQFSRFLDSAVDIQTGLITVSARAPSKEDAEKVALKALAATQLQINSLNDTLFDSQIDFARTAVDVAQTNLAQAQQDLVNLQLQSGEADPRLRVSRAYETISQLETEALALQTELQKAQIAGRGESFLAQQTQQLEARMRGSIQDVRQELLEGNGTIPSLNAQLVQYEMAELKVRIAEDGLANALRGLTSATAAAANGRSQFQVIVPPRTGQSPATPNTIPILLMMGMVLMARFVCVRMLRSGRSMI